jgi:histidinol-phosphatase (PHP family)
MDFRAETGTLPGTEARTAMLIDYHMHTELTDGRGRPIEYAAVAIQRGLDEIGFSDHAPLPDRDTNWTLKRPDVATYVGWVREAQARYPQLPIKLALEVDYAPGCEPWVRELAQMHPWDYLLGSVHFIGDWPVDASAKDWIGQDVDARWREYFELWRGAARSGLYDSLPHPDLPKKFRLRPAGDLTEAFEAALRDVAAAGIAIEVSTAGLRKPCRELYPSLDFLKIARRLAIPVQLGSDAHLPEEVGQDFDQAVAHLRSAGYSEIVRFAGRKREIVPLG